MFWIELLEKIFRPLSIIAIIAVAAAVLGHYLIFGPHWPELKREKKDIHRFNRVEMLIHAVTLLSFVALAVTGFYAALCGEALVGTLRLVHLTAAPFLALGLAGMALIWSYDGRFLSCDWQWAKKFGGYLYHVEYIPADRFNAGQKGFYWAVAVLGIICMASGIGRIYPVFGTEIQLLILAAHRYSSLLLVLFVLAHIYLGTLANPGTWQAPFFGYVGYNWSKKHHPLWWQRQDKSDKK